MTRCVLATAVIYFLHEGCDKAVILPTRLSGAFFVVLSIVSRSAMACKHTIMPRTNAVNPQHLCIAIRTRAAREVPPMVRPECHPLRDRSVKGQKSYWVRFHANVTLAQGP